MPVDFKVRWPLLIGGIYVFVSILRWLHSKVNSTRADQPLFDFTSTISRRKMFFYFSLFILFLFFYCVCFVSLLLDEGKSQLVTSPDSWNAVSHIIFCPHYNYGENRWNVSDFGQSLLGSNPPVIFAAFLAYFTTPSNEIVSLKCQVQAGSPNRSMGRSLLCVL